MQKGATTNSFPLFLLLHAADGNSQGCDAKEMQCAGRVYSVSEVVVIQWHLVYQRMRISLKPLEVYYKCVLLMLWMKNWLGI